MKKTSYILFATLLVFAVLAFLCPLFLYKTEKVTEIRLARTGKEVSRTLGRFEAVNVNGSDYYNYDVDDFQSLLRIEVIEKDSVFPPTVVMDSSWVGNVSLNIDNEGLELQVDMKRIQEETGVYPYVKVDKDNALLAKIYVPRGMLKSVSPAVTELTLKDFRNSSLRLNNIWNGVTATECSFKELELNNN